MCCVNKTTTPAVHKKTLWSEGANIQHVHNVLTDAESAFLIRTAEDQGKCSRSTVIGERGKQTSSSRTSTSCFLPGTPDETTMCIRKKLSRIAGRDEKNMEPLQVTRYTKGQEYKSHYDFFVKNHKQGDRQRTATLFAYLKSPGEQCGGGTIFPNCKTDGEALRIQPIAGQAVLWDNLNDDESGNKMTLHRGEPVECDGEKVGLNVWFGDRPFGK